MIGQILEYNTVVTKAEFLFMIQSVNLPPSAHIITSSVHCSTLQPSAVICSQPSSAHPVHTHCNSHYIFRAHCSHVQLSAANLQCTLQPCTAMYSYLQPIFSAHCSHVQPCSAIYSQSSVHTAAILSSAHCSYTIWCQYNTVHPVHLWTTTG